MHTSVVRIELRSIHTTLEKCENAALFVRVGLSSTCTNPSKKMKFSKTLFKPEEFKNAGFMFNKNPK